MCEKCRRIPSPKQDLSQNNNGSLTGHYRFIELELLNKIGLYSGDSKCRQCSKNEIAFHLSYEYGIWITEDKQYVDNPN